VRNAACLSWGSLGTWFAVAVSAGGAIGCGGVPESTSDTLQGEVVTVPTQNGAPDAVAPEPSLTCTAAAQGCPCPHDGETVQCYGPTIHSGNYTSCAPGRRACAGGVWGPCVGKKLYQSADTLTEDYVSPCPPGTVVRWGAIALEGLTPGDSRLEARVQAADTIARLEEAPVVRVARFDGPRNSEWTSPNVEALLASSGSATLSHLRVTIALVPSSEGSRPTVVDWSQAIACTSAR
jgi:hypothetical protein